MIRIYVFLAQLRNGKEYHLFINNSTDKLTQPRWHQHEH